MRTGKARGEEGGNGRAAVAGTGDAHRESFVLLGKPACTERQSHAETGAGDAQQNTHGEHVGEGVHKQEAVHECYADRGHLHDGGVLATDVLAKHTEREAHERAGERGHGHHEADLRRGEVVLLGDEGGHRAVEHPDGEAEVEVEKRRKQRRGVAGLEEHLGIRHGLALVYGVIGVAARRDGFAVLCADQHAAADGAVAAGGFGPGVGDAGFGDVPEAWVVAVGVFALVCVDADHALEAREQRWCCLGS